MIKNASEERAETIDLSSKDLCGINSSGRIYTAKVITAIAEMLKVNETLKAIR